MTNTGISTEKIPVGRRHSARRTILPKMPATDYNTARPFLPTMAPVVYRVGMPFLPMIPVAHNTSIPFLPRAHSAFRPILPKAPSPHQTTLIHSMKIDNQSGDTSMQSIETLNEGSNGQHHKELFSTETPVDIFNTNTSQFASTKHQVGSGQNITIITDRSRVNDNQNDEILADEQTILPEEAINGVLYNYFEEVQQRLSEKYMPAEYDAGTFWIRPMRSFFALMRGKPMEYLYRPDIFLWIPHLLLHNKIHDLHCPKCNSPIQIKGFNKKPHARRVVDIKRCFYLMTERYRCHNIRCASTFNGYDSGIMRQLPAELQAEFPAYLTHKKAFSKQLRDLQ